MRTTTIVGASVGAVVVGFTGKNSFGHVLHYEDME
jgi:hypothetical protein